MIPFKKFKKQLRVLVNGKIVHIKF